MAAAADRETDSRSARLNWMRFIWHETFLPLGAPQTVPRCAGVKRASAGFRSPEQGWRSRATPVLARWRSRGAERGLRQAGCVATDPAAGCSRLQSFICCGPASPQVWPGMSSTDLEVRRAGTVGIHGVRLLLGNERSKGKRRDPFHGRGRAAKGRLCGFLGIQLRSQPQNGCVGCSLDQIPP